MADKLPLYASLVDAAGDGQALHKVLEGDAAAAKNASAGLIAKDVAGNLRYPLVDAQRRFVVSTEAGDTANLSGNGTVVGNAAFVTVASITLGLAMTYKELSALLGCYRDAEFKFVHNDDGTPAIIAQGALVGSGSPSLPLNMPAIEFTSGATGTQQLLVQAKNLSATSDFRATVAIKEVQ